MSYDDFASTFSQSRKNLRWAEIEYFIAYIQEHFLGKRISILDVGCGNGRFLDSLALWERVEVRASYLGIDESIGMIDEARKLHPEYMFQALDMNRLEELSDTTKYDVIVFIASFHHLHTKEERQNVLQKTKNLLSLGGIVMMTNWNLFGEPLFTKYQTWYKWSGDFSIKIGTHERYYHGFSTEELSQLFQENNYKILENRVFEWEKNIISLLKI